MRTRVARAFDGAEGGGLSPRMVGRLACQSRKPSGEKPLAGTGLVRIQRLGLGVKVAEGRCDPA